jgi:hypothetical protein
MSELICGFRFDAYDFIALEVESMCFILDGAERACARNGTGARGHRR